RYWVHNGFVNLGKAKMSKSLGNTLTIRDIVKRHHPEALRLWILGTHYRHLLEWSEERVEEAARALARLTRLVDDASAAGAARGPRAFGRSGELRAEIQRLGWLVEDTPGGPRLTRKSG